MYDSESDRDEPPKLKVIDRRLFDSEGNLRDGVTAEEGTAGEPGQNAAAEVTRKVEPVASESTAASSLEPAKQLKLGEEALMRFVEEQYIGGLLALGAMPDPQTGQVAEDLELAQVRIEVLAMLQEHAGDGLAPEAKKGLDDVIYQLRMAYLQKSKVTKL